MSTFKVVVLLGTGTGAHGVVIDPSGRYAYITSIYGTPVTVIDIQQKKVIATVPSGAAPNGISFSTQPAVPASSNLMQLESPETEMIEMQGMTP